MLVLHRNRQPKKHGDSLVQGVRTGSPYGDSRAGLGVVYGYATGGVAWGGGTLEQAYYFTQRLGGVWVSPTQKFSQVFQTVN